MQVGAQTAKTSQELGQQNYTSKVFFSFYFLGGRKEGWGGCCLSSYDYNEKLIPLWWDVNHRWAPRLNINTCFRLEETLRWLGSHSENETGRKKKSRSQRLWLQLFSNSAAADSSATITQYTRVLKADERRWPEDAKVAGGGLVRWRWFKGRALAMDVL